MQSNDAINITLIVITKSLVLTALFWKVIKQYFLNLMILGYLIAIIPKSHHFMFSEMCFVLKIHVSYPVLPTITNVFYQIDLPRIIVCFILMSEYSYGQFYLILFS